MLKAERNALFQEANKHIISIRKQEFDHLIGVYRMFSALVAGFTVSILTQINGLDSTISPFWKWLFWICCILVMICTLHVMLTTMCLKIFGTQYAMRGPSGSLVKAADGLHEELYTVLVPFFLAILFFQGASIACNFFMMSFIAASTSSIIMLLGFYYWYIYLERMYNRFQVRMLLRNPEEDESRYSSSRPSTSRSDAGVAHDSPLPIGERDGIGMQEFVSKNQDNCGSGEADMEGYMLKKGVATAILNDLWKRRYFVLRGSELRYYSTKEHYQRSPEHSLKSRPIYVDNYSLSSGEDSTGVYYMKLYPNDSDSLLRVWEFMVDTESELQLWTISLKRAGMNRTNDKS